MTLPKGIRGVCGNSHVIVLVISIITTIVSLAAVWGSLTAKVDGLEHTVAQLGNLQEAWNLEEHRTDDAHRERINQIEARIFQLVYHLGDGK